MHGAIYHDKLRLSVLDSYSWKTRLADFELHSSSGKQIGTLEAACVLADKFRREVTLHELLHVKVTSHSFGAVVGTSVRT